MYLFDIIGVTSVLDFFHQQQAQQAKLQTNGIAYIGSYTCSLDAVIQSVENTCLQLDWRQEDILQSIIDFWLGNLDSVQHWQRRFADAGRDTLLVSRIADPCSLRQELETLFQAPSS